MVGRDSDIPTDHNPLIHVDCDAPGDGRSIRFWLEKHQAAYPDGDRNQIEVLEPDSDTYGLGLPELEELA